MMPAAHLVLYLITLILAVPPLLAAGYRHEKPDSELLASLGVMSILMMPGALGRCDPPHVIFYGLVVSMMLILRLAGLSMKVYRAYAIAYAVVFIVLMQVVNLVCFFGLGPAALFRNPLGAIRSVINLQRSEFAPRNYAYLSALDKYPAIGIPFATFGYDNAAEEYLFAHRKIDPEFYVATVGVYTKADISQKLADTARHEYLLVDQGWMQPGEDSSEKRYLRDLRRWFLYPARLQWKRPDLNPSEEINRFIAEHYRMVEEVGHSVIVRRND
jgi:hypothetical protein